MTRCRDCALYDLDAVKNKAGAVLSTRAAKCNWESTEIYPASARHPNRRPDLFYMEPNVVHDCKTFVQRKK